MVLKEIRGNLFSADKKFYFAHCISSDFALGKGIAVQFNTIYDMRNRLRKECGPVGQCPGCVRIDNVYNLITKPRYFNKPTYDSLEQSLLLVSHPMAKARGFRPEGFDEERYSRERYPLSRCPQIGMWVG